MWWVSSAALAGAQIAVEALVVEISDEALAEGLTHAPAEVLPIAAQALRHDPRADVIFAPTLLTSANQRAELTVEGTRSARLLATTELNDAGVGGTVDLAIGTRDADTLVARWTLAGEQTQVSRLGSTLVLLTATDVSGEGATDALARRNAEAASLYERLIGSERPRARARSLDRLIAP